MGRVSVSIIVAKYNIFPALNFLAKRFAHAIIVHCRDLEHAYYTEFDCVALLAVLSLLNNIAGGIVHQIQREKRTTISEVIVCGKRNISKIGIGFISIFLLKARVLYLTILNGKI